MEAELQGIQSSLCSDKLYKAYLQGIQRGMDEDPPEVLANIYRVTDIRNKTEINKLHVHHMSHQCVEVKVEVEVRAEVETEAEEGMEAETDVKEKVEGILLTIAPALSRARAISS